MCSMQCPTVASRYTKQCSILLACGTFCIEVRYMAHPMKGLINVALYPLIQVHPFHYSIGNTASYSTAFLYLSDSSSCPATPWVPSDRFRTVMGIGGQQGSHLGLPIAHDRSDASSTDSHDDHSPEATRHTVNSPFWGFHYLTRENSTSDQAQQANNGGLNPTGFILVINM